MSIVLAILKWIGIVIGVIIGLLLLLAGILLLIPVRYYIEAQRDEEHFFYGFSVSWLCHLVTVKKKKESDNIRFWVFGIPFGRHLFSGKEKPAKKPAVVNKEEHEDGQTGQTREITHKKSEKGKAATKKRKKRFSFHQFSSIIKEIRDKGNRRAVRALWGELWQLLRYLSPRKVKLDMVLGTGDPCNTGLLFGGISMVPWMYAEGIHIVPDFEEKAFKLEGHMKGRMRVIYLLRLLWRLYCNQDLKRFYNHIMKKEAA